MSECGEWTRQRRAQTFGLREVALLNTSLQGLVEQGVELGLGGDGDVVVCLDILLDSLSAVHTSAWDNPWEKPWSAATTTKGGRIH